MNSYIKHIIETFDFASINKQKKNINAIDIILLNIVNKILDNNKLTNDEKEYILSLPVAYYKTNNKKELIQLIDTCVLIFGNECNLNWIDTSNITDMHGLFAGNNLSYEYKSKFNGDISKWDVSNVRDMSNMFERSKFNRDISNWNVSNVTNMNNMFHNSIFDNDISSWDVSNVKDMHNMFGYSLFTGDISMWDVSNVTDMECMFYYSIFNGDISKWNVSNVTNMYAMFAGEENEENVDIDYTEFDGDLSNWNVSNVTDMSYMFSYSKFDSDISMWNINTKCDTDGMFDNCSIREEYKPKI